MDEDEAFPRGGQATLSQLERREIARQAKKDVLFKDAPEGEDAKLAAELEADAKELEKAAKGKKRKREAAATADADEKAEKRKFSVDVLSFKKLSVGMLMYGAVSEINEFELVVSLPHGLVGYVRPTDISPPYTESLLHAAEVAAAEAAKGDDSSSEDEDSSDSDAPPLSALFHVGQLLSCVIKETQSRKDSKKRRIRLSVHAPEVNQALSAEALRPGVTIHGYVSSIEEHGYVVSFGFKKRTGFLLSKRAKGYCKVHHGGRPLVLGQPVHCLVLDCETDSRVVQVTINPTEVADAIANSESVVRFSELTPGMLISGKVLQRAQNGVAISFLSGTAGMVSTLHLPDHVFNASQLPPAKRIKVRIIHINPTTKVVGCSGQRHILDNKGADFPEIHVGSIVESAAVKHVDSQVGAVLQLNDTPMFGFAHISHVADERIEKLAKKHRVGTEHRCRVLGFNTLDALASLSLQQSILDRPFLGFKDVVLGTPVRVEIVSVHTAGLVVAVSDHLHGFVPLMHLADVPLKKPTKKFKEGGKINCRILEVTPARRRLLLTAKKSLVRSELPLLCKVDQAVTGNMYCGFVAGIRHYGLIVAFYGGTKGLLHRTELANVASYDDDLAKLYYVGQVVQCQVLSVDHGKIRLSTKTAEAAARGMGGRIAEKKHRTDAEKSLTDSQASASAEASSKDGKKSTTAASKAGLVKITIGDIVTASVRSVHPMQVNVSLGHNINGRVHVSNFMDSPEEGKWPFEGVRNGDEIKCRVLGFREVKSHRHLDISHHAFYKALELSSKASIVNDLTMDEAAVEAIGSREELSKLLTPEATVTAFVKDVFKKNVNLVLTPNVRATIPVLSAASTGEIAAHPEKYFKPGTVLSAVVANYDKREGVCHLKADGSVSIGQVTSCRIAKVLPGDALLVELPGIKNYARCCLTDISDCYEEDPLKGYANKIARCYILSKRSNGQYDVSLRPSRTSGSSSSNGSMPDESATSGRHEPPENSAAVVRDPEVPSVADIKAGQVLRGYVKAAVDNAGLFVRLSRTVVGRAKITNLSENFVKNWKKAYPTGKLVTTKVLSVDYTQNKVELSLRDSHISPEKRKHSSAKNADKKRTKLSGGRVLEVSNQDSDDEDTEDSDAELRQMMEEEGVEVLTSDSEPDDDEEEEAEGSTAALSSSREEEDGESSDDDEAAGGRDSAACLKLPSKFDWFAEVQGGDAQHADSSSDEDDEDDSEMSQSQRKKSRRQKRAEKKQEEANLRSLEEAMLDTEKPTETVDDFERLVVKHPNQSQVWVRFMSCHLHSAEVEKARAVAKRALDTISFREESEKLTVWVAWMNLENTFGTQDSLLKVFQQALQGNDPEKVFFRLASVYVKSKKFELADDLYSTMVKRFSQTRDVWEQYGLFKFRQEKPEAARRILDRSLKSLPKFEHVTVISKFAQMEFKHGEAERGRTMFESLVTNYPKRVDLWYIYIDMLQRDGNADAVMNVFDRVVNLKLSSKKMKSVLKRKAEFEESRMHADV